METDKELTLEDLPPLGEDERNWWNEHNDEYVHYLYRIVNTINNKYYYGIHSVRKDSGKTPETDGYMGSGRDIIKAEKKYGMDKFTKIIVKTFSTRDEARLEEMRLVNEDLVKDKMCYNLTIGGCGVPITTGYGVYTNINDSNDIRYLPIKDPLVISGQFVGCTKGKGVYKNKNNPNDIRQLPTNDPLVTSGEYISLFTGIGVYKSRNNYKDIKLLSLDDPLVTSGEYVGISYGIKKTKEIISKTTGERNGMFGTVWITNGVEEKQVKRDIPIPEGWKVGRALNMIYRECINLKTHEKKILNESEMNNDPNWVPSFLFNNSDLYITKEIVENLYNKHNNWVLVSKELDITIRRMRTIRKYYGMKEKSRKQ